MSDISPTEGVQSATRAQFVAGAKKARLHNIIQQESKETFQARLSQGDFSNPLARQKKFKELDKRNKAAEEPAKAEVKPESTADPNKAQTLAKFFQKRNAEMDAQKLLSLLGQIKISKDGDEVLEKTLRQFSDPSLADEALDYLLETLPPGSAAREKVKQAKEKLRARKEREVRAGRNMGDISRSHPQLGSPSDLRNLYREVTHNLPDAQTLFEELIQKFNYEKMCEAIEFMLHSLGSDLTAKGSSISRSQLQALISEARNMQAILGVYDFFKERTGLVKQQFDIHHIPLSPMLNFEKLAKVLVTLLKERYPSTDKILRLAHLLGISHDILAQIIIFSQYRDAMRGVAPRLFKSEKHRQDMLLTLIEALSELEEESEEEEE